MTVFDWKTGSKCLRLLVNSTPIPLFLRSTLAMTALPLSRIVFARPVNSEGSKNTIFAESLAQKDRHLSTLMKAPPWLKLTLVPFKALKEAFSPTLASCT